MIKANELRIGNYYLPTDGSLGPVKVTADDLKAWSMGAVYGKEIPLTTEILERCGFEYIGHSNLYHISGMQIYTDSFGRPGYYFRYADLLETKIKHLHQLQNLYFDLLCIELKISESVFTVNQ